MDGNTTIATLPLARLRVWPGNPRKTVPDLTDLTASVAKSGVLSPLLVRELPAPAGAVTHEVIAGQCRYLAATAAGLVEVPVLVRALDDATALELGLVENAQRNDPAPLEEAEALDALVRTHGRSVEDVAARLGRPVAWARRRLSLLGLGREARAWLASGKLPLAHALQLAAVDEATQLRVVERFRHVESLPSSKLFAQDVTTYLRTLASAPFDAAGCAGCSTRTDVQTDLFGATPENARCLGPTCWDAKVAGVWAEAQKAAKKRRLPVIAEPVEHDWRGLARLPDGRLLTATAPSEGARPAAVARDRHGRVLDLYEPPPAPSDGDAAEEDEAEVPDDREARAAAAQARRDAAAAARKVQVAAFVEALTRSPAALVAGLRVALLTAARDLDCGRDLRVVCEAWGGSAAFATDADIVADLRAADLPLVLVATLCAAWATDPDAEDATPVERTLRELVRGGVDAPEELAPVGQRKSVHGPFFDEDKGMGQGPWVGAKLPCSDCASIVLQPDERAQCPTCGAVHAGADVVPASWDTKPAATPATARLWIAEAAWDALTPDARDDLTEPFGGTTVNWQGTEGYVFADVPRDETLNALQGMAEALLVEMVESAERPATGAAVAAEPPQRVIIVSEEGDDWKGARKGLAAWNAEKTPGAGFTAGGRAAPLAMLHTPRVDSADVGKLLARYAKAGRLVLDLGVVDGDKVFDCDPSNRAVRQQWNAVHPKARVSVPEAPRAQKGGRK